MGYIDFEGWKVEINDLQALNRSPEVVRMGLVFQQEGDLTYASAKGNVAAYYVILLEVWKQLVTGGFNVTVELGAGDKKEIILSTDFVIENGEDASWIIQ